jgi:hypothetical protein
MATATGKEHDVLELDVSLGEKIIARIDPLFHGLG